MIWVPGPGQRIRLAATRLDIQIPSLCISCSQPHEVERPRRDRDATGRRLSSPGGCDRHANLNGAPRPGHPLGKAAGRSGFRVASTALERACSSPKIWACSLAVAWAAEGVGGNAEPPRPPLRYLTAVHEGYPQLPRDSVRIGRQPCESLLKRGSPMNRYPMEFAENH